MSWWVWLILWVLLVLGTLALYAGLGLGLWRRSRALIRQFGSVSAQWGQVLSSISAAGEISASREHPDSVSEAPSGIMIEPSVARAQFLAGVRARKEARARARAVRKYDRGQPRTLRDTNYL